MLKVCFIPSDRFPADLAIEEGANTSDKRPMPDPYADNIIPAISTGWIRIKLTIQPEFRASLAQSLGA